MKRRRKPIGIEYGKLVRDLVPGIIREGGDVPITHRADDAEYADKLMEKLREELDEFAASGEIEELADLLEVIRALAELNGVGWAELDEMRAQKARERGQFAERFVLDKVRDA